MDAAKQVKAIEAIMGQAQVFAGAWSLVGGVFDSGQMLDDANDAKAELRAMVTEALQELEAENASLRAFAQRAAEADRERNPLTVEQIQEYADPFVRCLGGDHWYTGEDGISSNSGQIELFVRVIEAAHKIKE